ncbi:MAG: helix-turn-helix transcriptional regulator, partial [Nitrospirota bacterium]|nr:helix-turn-helix transcriptional regulator [Nitrospirota bacterium]
MNMTGTNLRLHRQQLGLSQANLAELSGISQHILSAFELGKTDLPQTLRETVSQALANKKMVATLAEREKRYRQHKYDEVPKLPERVTRAARTIGNT